MGYRNCNDFFECGIGGGVNLSKLWLCPFPLMGSNWFVMQYLILYIISPMLNLFVESVSKHYIKQFLIFAFGVNVYVGYICHNMPFGDGFNFIFMSTLYLLGRYMRLYCEERIHAYKQSHFMLLSVIGSITLAFFIFYWYVYNIHKWPSLYAYNNPLVIYLSICIFCVFIKLDFRSVTVNKFATSCFAILLIHMHPLVGNYYYLLFRQINQCTHILAFVLCMIALVLIMIASYIIDKGRQSTYRWILDKISLYLKL